MFIVYCLGIKKMSLNAINDLLQQSKTTLELIDDLQKLLNDAQNKLNKGDLDDTDMYYLREAVIRILTLTNAFLKKFNAFMDDQNKQHKPNEQKSM